MRTDQRVRFPERSAFHDDLNRRIDGYFEGEGRSRHGGWRMGAKSAVLIGWLAGSWYLLMFAPVHAWEAVLLSMSVGLAMARVGFSVMHDADLGGRQFPPPRGRALFVLLAGKAAFIAWAFVVPALLHPSWALVGLWAIAIFTLGNVLAGVFQLAHCIGEADFVVSSRVHADWAEHQIATTVDFARSNALLCWYLCGLNFQVEHHLFPRVCHLHYPALAAIVEETCRAHGVRYRFEPTLRSALAANFAWLHRMGLPAATATAG